MPWIIAELRGQRVYARADAQGQLAVASGRVEIRYRPNDGRLYQAGARNLSVIDPTPLPDDFCAAAEAVSPKRPNAVGTAVAAETPAAPRTARPGRTGRPARGSPGARAAEGPPPTPGELVVYTDGACSSNPGPAGLGVVLLRHAERVELSEYLGQGTNNVAELTAVLRALDELGETPAARIHTDSQYAIGVLQRGWKAKANRELVARIRAELQRRPGVTLCYVPGHEGVPLNERADELARLAITSRRSRRVVLPADPDDPPPNAADRD